MPSVKSVFVSCEKVLAKVEKEFPNLVKTVTSAGSSIIGAGTGFTLAQVAASAKKHNPAEDKVDVEYHPEKR